MSYVETVPCLSEILAIPQSPTKMWCLIIATCQDKEKKIDVNFYLNVRFCICIMSLIPLQAMCHVYL
jgi:hypothetical protein